MSCSQGETRKDGVAMEMKPDTTYPDCKDKKSFESGLEFQDFVCTELMKHGIVLQNLSSKQYQFTIGESLQGFEIKLDRRFLETNRLSIEIAEKSKASVPVWTDSGIYRKDNTWLYIQGNKIRLYIFQKSLLVELHKSGKFIEDESYGTVRKFYLPIDKADKWCAKRIDLGDDHGK